MRRITNMYDDKLLVGVTGTAVSAAGTTLSATETQAIISTIITVAGFVISVLIPLGIKIYKWFKKAREDGKIDEKEVDELADIIKIKEDKKHDN